MAGAYFTGCAVWAFKDWVGSFYPKGSKAGDFLRLYGDRMTAVEGNTTFYSMPDAKTIDRWAATMPPGFRFCPKLPRAFSHQGKLMPFVESSHRFLQTLMPLGDRLGPLFIQLPPTYSPEQMGDLREFLARWPRQTHPIAVEVRHLDWFAEPHATHLNQMLTSLSVGRVLLDTRPIYDCINTPDDDPQIGSERKKPRVPLQPMVTAPFTIVRYISHPDLAYNQTYFDEWVPRLHQWLEASTDVYFFAHCPQEARSPAVAREVYHQLQQAGVNLPELLWDGAKQQKAKEDNSSAQLSLFG
ncbi:MAG: DUF72 domain-containing protein [Leptolyngbya sp.]|nr:MAG: DUF72 domain-containing protein [Leptolyngbya sp.]